MSLRKHYSGTWWVDFHTPNGERIRRTTGTKSKAEAQEYHDQLKSETWRLRKLGDRPRRSWNEAAVRWIKEQQHKATHDDDKAKLRWLDPYSWRPATRCYQSRADRQDHSSKAGGGPQQRDGQPALGFGKGDPAEVCARMGMAR